ncbi:MAG TPA: cupin domain-containing protein [Pyrinomonadaceae bacterium]|nr:cupin domain-containing protein [Pyrinomonadaceae bacterium]
MSKFVLSLVALVLLSVTTWAYVQDKKHADKTVAGGSANHVLVTPDALAWGPAPPGLPAGAEIAVLQGDPSKAGLPFSMRAKFPDGYTIAPHWHPTDENVLVLQGTMMLGLGEKFDQTAAREMPAGSYGLMPKGMRHFAMAKGETIIQIYGIGPFEINYVNAADDPRNKK